MSCTLRSTNGCLTSSAKPRAGPVEKGCDQCCRHLAQVPELTEAEWKLLAQGVARLEPDIQAEIAHRIQALSDRAPGNIVCPLLDDVEGTCRVYAYRPATCRLFGFYQSRDANWWCDLIQARYESGEFNDVIFGNQTAINRKLHHKGGQSKSLTDWFNFS